MLITKHRRVYVSDTFFEVFRGYVKQIEGNSDGARSLDWDITSVDYYADMEFITIPTRGNPKLLLTCSAGIVWELTEFTNRGFVTKCFTSDRFVESVNDAGLIIVDVDEQILKIQNKSNPLHTLTFTLLKGFLYDIDLRIIFATVSHIHQVDINGTAFGLHFTVSDQGKKLIHSEDLSIKWILKTASTPMEIALAVKCFSDQSLQLGATFNSDNTVALFEKKRPRIQIIFEPPR